MVEGLIAIILILAVMDGLGVGDVSSGPASHQGSADLWILAVKS
jgi:hypothetical protein